jgi:epidermal growth factor receptor substrate 15
MESNILNGLIGLIGETAKQIFERTKLPNEVLGRIWNLADTQQRGELGLTEFTIAMHLIASYRNGTLRALPQVLPAGLYEAASRRGGPRPLPGSRPASGMATVSPVSRQFSGSGFSTASSPGLRPPLQQLQPSSGDEWAIGTREKESFDQIFSTLDTANRGFIPGDQAVSFFGNSRLPEEVLAQIWDLADINSEGRLSRDEFAVAMFLVRQQRTKRDVLPQTLPPNLIPPSMRRPSLAPSHPMAPDRPPITAKKSAAEDLFELDDSTSSVTLGTFISGNQSLQSSSPFHAQGSTQAHQEPLSSASLKSFVPPLPFNQAIMTASGSASPQAAELKAPEKPARGGGLQQRSTMNDLLGDNDPEISKKLTQETADLANLSNQVSHLTSQMQEVKAKRISTEQDLSMAQSQKRDFEVRLSQLRSAYEQENIVVRTLGERLLISKNELRKLEEEIAQIDGTHQDLQARHRELAAALEADKRENATIKERIRQSNIEINVLRPQLEKLKSDARQQKGLVAINKKQLATNEIEREKIKREVEGASKELEEATHEAEQTARKLQEVPDAGGSTTLDPDAIASRPPPAINMNPFFRRPPTEPSEQGTSSPFNKSTAASPNHNAFDSFFGPSPTPHPQDGPPATTFLGGPTSMSDEQPPAPALSVKPPEGHSIISSSGSILSSADIDTPYLPPAPPRSRQITSSFLPLRNLQRSESTSSSVMVAPPGSRGGGVSGSETPTDQHPTSPGSLNQLNLKQKLDSIEAKSQEDDLQSSPNSADDKSPSPGESGDAQHRRENKDETEAFGQPSTTIEIPGAFPGDAALESSTRSSTSNSSKSTEDRSAPSTVQHMNRSAPSNDQSRTSTSPRDDFNAAFESFGDKGKGVAKTHVNTSSDDLGRLGSSKARGEFPPIEEFGSNDDSDSESDYGFDDNFTPGSPERPQNDSEAHTKISSKSDPSSEEGHSPLSLPSNAVSGLDQAWLPKPVPESSPAPHYQTVTPNEKSGNQNPYQLPAEYASLLPSQDTMSSYPTSPAETTSEKISSPSKQGESLGPFPSRMTGEAPPSFAFPPVQQSPKSASLHAPFTPEQAPSMPFQPQPVIPAKTALNDDFEAEFGDLTEAKEADGKGEDDVIPLGKEGFDDFNPIFDSPTPSRTTVNPPSSWIPTENSFHDFESTITDNGAPPGPLHANNQPFSNQNHDWDAMFAGLGIADNKSTEPLSESAGEAGTTATQPGAPSSAEVVKPAFSRGLSTGTEHDDPILKRLTVMGYSREASLSALEKFDYNIDQVSFSRGKRFY